MAPPAPKLCDQAGCQHAGEYKAPKSIHAAPTNEGDYHLFCLEHVQIYNKAWNYYGGMTAEEIEQHVRKDVTWDRPSWPFGQKSNPYTNGAEGAQNNEGRFYYNAEFLYQNNWQKFVDSLNGFMHGGDADYDLYQQRARKILSEEELALALFGLTLNATKEELKKRYKELGKKYHPDLNGGDKEKEDFFKKINQAYQILKNMLG